MQPVEVRLVDAQPSRLSWKRKQLTVEEVADHWREHGRWWEGEAECEYFLVNTASGCFLLCRNLADNHWYVKPVQ